MGNTQWLRARAPGRVLGVDKAKKKIFGAILAEQGPFKDAARGEFSGKSIRAITKLAKQARGGLRVRFGHPNLSASGLGTMLGRMHSITTESIEKEIRGETVNALVSRGDIHFSDSAFNTPSGDLASYTMQLVSEDSGGDNAGMSLVLTVDEELRVDAKGRRLLDDDGVELPPLWHPTKLLAVDVVDEGAATSSMLQSASIEVDGLRDETLWKAEALLQKQFAGKDRGFVEEHLTAWVTRALDAYWPLKESTYDINLAGIDDLRGFPAHAEILKRRLALKLK